MKAVLVTGATGVVGPFLVRRLLEAGHPVVAISRRPSAARSEAGLRWERFDLAGGLDLAPPVPDTMIHAAPLWLLPPILGTLARAGLRRVVAFSSASRFSKEHSPDRSERAVASRLARAEGELAEIAAAHGIAETVLRPTLIYGGGRDRNVGDIVRLARRLGLVPLAGDAGGRRQPVHADDLAEACVRALEAPVTHGRSYDLGGGETLTYQAMALRAARTASPAARAVHLPLPVARGLLRLLSLVPGFAHVTPAMADRMNEDLLVDDSLARVELGWAPRPFLCRADEGGLA